jgi:hypothetical protein
MDEQGEGGPDPEDAEPPPGLPQLPPQVHSDADELRRLIDAGASSPEELRALAARIREHRELEESLWRQEVKPALLESKKRRFRLADLRDRPGGGGATSDGSSLGVGLFVVGAVLVLLLLATQSSALFVIVPVVGVLAYAYRQGRREVATPPRGETPQDPPH